MGSPSIVPETSEHDTCCPKDAIAFPLAPWMPSQGSPVRGKEGGFWTPKAGDALCALLRVLLEPPSCRVHLA
jgi:hypothetical protein